MARIVPIVPEDQPEIYALIAAAWTEHGKPDPMTVFPELADPCGYYRAQGGKMWKAVIGVGAASMIAGTIAYRPHPKRNTFEFEKLYVRKDLRRGKIATDLMAFIENQMPPYAVVEGWSDLKMKAAHKFYDRWGFARGGQRRSPDGTVRQHFFKVLGP